MVGRPRKVLVDETGIKDHEFETNPLGSKPKLVNDKRVNRYEIEIYAMMLAGYGDEDGQLWRVKTTKQRNQYRKLAAELLNEDYTDG